MGNNLMALYANNHTRTHPETQSGQEIIFDGAAGRYPVHAPMGLTAQGKGMQTKLDGASLWRSFPNQTLDGVTLTVLPDGGYVLNGICTASNNFVLSNISLGGDYTLSAGNTEKPYTAYPLIQVYSPSTFSSIEINNPDSIGIKRTATLISANDYMIRIRIQQGVEYKNFMIHPMLTTAENADHPYEPYCGGIPSPNPDYPQPLAASTATLTVSGWDNSNPVSVQLPTLRAIPDGKGGWACRDELQNIGGGNGKVTRRVEVKAFDGTEAVGKWVYNDILLGFYISGLNLPEQIPLCSHFKQATVNPPSKKDDSIAIKFGWIYFGTVAFETVDGFKTFLAAQHAAGTPVTVWYGLAAPTTEMIDLPTLMAAEGYTRIAAEGSEIKPQITLTAQCLGL